MASEYILLMWYMCARLKATAYVRSTLIWSWSPFCSRCLQRRRSFLPASFALSRALPKSLFSAAMAESSSISFTLRSISRHASSALASARFCSVTGAPLLPWLSGSNPGRALCGLLEYPAALTAVIGRASSPAAAVAGGMDPVGTPRIPDIGRIAVPGGGAPRMPEPGRALGGIPPEVIIDGGMPSSPNPEPSPPYSAGPPPLPSYIFSSSLYPPYRSSSLFISPDTKVLSPKTKRPPSPFRPMMVG
mmetsp:Transcript_40697/g.129839  ORF Transcript_40697/g.129839 Transcript_40697/m.129839 type:complete len:247 (+) Transcript_40697:1691-2431(+)